MDGAICICNYRLPGTWDIMQTGTIEIIDHLGLHFESF